MTVACTVRGCGQLLSLDGDRLVCPRGHAFDRAREGYWNLLQPQDRKSSDAGDRVEATKARRRWLARGFADGLAAFVRDVLNGRGGIAADIGCGEGTLTARVFEATDFVVHGVDLSSTAIAMAAKQAPAFTWLVANADRALPFGDRSLDVAVSIFGRRPAAELSRVLKPGGHFIAVLPGPSDLIELRAAAQGEGIERDRADQVVAGFSAMTLIDRRRWEQRAPHDREALLDALAMSYRGARTSEQSRMGAIDTLDVTLQADVCVLRN